MARKRLSPIGEEGRRFLKEMGSIDDRYEPFRISPTPTSQDICIYSI